MKIIEHILSFKKEKRMKADGLVCIYRKLTVLGLKIKIKLYEYYKPQNKIPNWLETYLKLSWNTLYCSEFEKAFFRNFQTLELAFLESGIEISPTYLLIAISLFIEDGANLKVQYLLNQYISKYGEKDLHEWLVISNYLTENNLTCNKKILNAARLYKIFEKSEHENVFESYIRGKTVAVGKILPG